MIGTGIIGAITGGAMPLVSTILDFADRKNRRKFELDKLAYEERVAKEESKMKKLKLDVDIQQSMLEDVQSARKGDGAKYFNAAMLQGAPSWVAAYAVVAFATVDTLRGMVRPLVTYSLIAATIYFAGVHDESTLAIAVFELTGAALGFWFGQKAHAQCTKLK